VAGGAAALLVGFISLLFVLALGSVSGTEFSPDTFTQRQFHYWELPLVRWRLTEVWHIDVSGPLEETLRDDPALIPPSGHDPPRWRLVDMQIGSRTFTDDARLVCRYFDAQRGGVNRWQAWTNARPELAKILWPAIAELCRQEMYSSTPLVFDAAEQLTVPADAAPTPAEFQAAIAAVLIEQYVYFAEVRQKQNKHEAAVALFTAALAHDKQSVAALEGRAYSYVALGQAEKAQQDRRRLREMEE
ncbi:MAG: tetratricopeptide repeat protein, partial [Planctomycetales bacterium]|nr:tetratricopeptide repeat protein [Planctomycetales bacterium]